MSRTVEFAAPSFPSFLFVWESGKLIIFQFVMIFLRPSFPSFPEILGKVGNSIFNILILFHFPTFPFFTPKGVFPGRETARHTPLGRGLTESRKWWRLAT